MFNKFSNYDHYLINNQSPRSHEIASRENSGRCSFFTKLHFRPYFKIPLDKKSATEVLKANFAIRENMEVPVMLEYKIDNCRMLEGSYNSNGSSYCIINIVKASVFADSNINAYTKPINFLVPVDQSEAN